MIWYLLAFMVGGTVGVFAAALLSANTRADDWDRAWMAGYKVALARMNNELAWPDE